MFNSVYNYLIQKREQLLRAPYESGEYLSYDFCGLTTESLAFRESFINNTLLDPETHYLFFDYVFEEYCDDKDNPVEDFACVLFSYIKGTIHKVTDETVLLRMKYEKAIRDCIQILRVLKEDFCGLDAPFSEDINLAYFDADKAVDTPQKQLDDKVTDPKFWIYYPNSFIKERLAHPEIKLVDPKYLMVEVRKLRSYIHPENLDDLDMCQDVILFTPEAYEGFKEDINSSKQIEDPSITKIDNAAENGESAFIGREVISYKVETFNDFVYHDEFDVTLTFDIFKGNVRLVSAVISKDRLDKSIYRHLDMGGFSYKTEEADQSSVLVYQ